MARGDHLEVNRGGFYHHGIDLGNGEVIHFTGDPFNKLNAQVSRELIADFAERGSPRVVPYSEEVMHPDHVCTIALGQWQRKKRGYSLTTNNCEHLASYCKTGVARSKQVEKFFSTLGQRVRLALLRPSGEALLAAVTGDIIIRVGEFVVRSVSEYIHPGKITNSTSVPPLYRQCRWWQELNGQVWIESVTPGWWLCWDSNANNFRNAFPPQSEIHFLYEEWIWYPDRLNHEAEIYLFENGNQWYVPTEAGLQLLSSEQAIGLNNLRNLICTICP